MPVAFQPHPKLPDVLVLEPRAFGDDRGWFMETYKRSEFEAKGIAHEFRQDNHSRSVGKGVIRGLHYQKDPLAQGKLVRCTVGAVFDVAADIRRGSPTYGKWVAVELSAENRKILWVPPGFLHGFCTLSDVTEVVYKTTAEYSPSHERIVRWDDPQLAITWPTRTPLLSPKDAEAPALADAENNFQWKQSS
ncbi:MAG: dTDP-4-dehydrorhamnose 3,5-epimerase [Deltaproteobacteria bacterium]|nr:dTDP-4-dehydrorhamnose 3,5-epimerase [Deltaproteobacteria bacterium]